MIIVQLLGGLGNQMFQYAAARRLSLKSELLLKLDTSEFEVYGSRRFALDHFAVVGERATPAEIRRLRGWAPRLQRRMPRWMRSLIARSHEIEPQFHFRPQFLNIRRPVYLSGFWQSEKYFADVKEVIRQDFTYQEPPTGQNLATLRLIRSGTSVSVHVRRGDYLHALGVHGTCSPEYYRAAIAEMVQRFADVRFFVFSDDMKWARDNLQLGAPISFVDHNGSDQDFEDLRLMSNCQHHIIANSTFSWWGAWLGEGHGKVVIAPKKWFATSARDTRDLYPAGWLLR